jgi:hypothetical protein
MAFTVDKALTYVKHALDGSPDADLDPEDLLNLVGEIFVGHHEWNFLNRRVERMAIRAAITVATVAYVDSGKTLTKSGAFANYDFVVGDYVTASQSSVTLAQATIASVAADGHSITLVGNDLAEWTGQNVDIVIDTARMPLPADWAGNLSMSATQLYTRNLVKATPAEMLELRTQQVAWAGINTWACPMWGKTAGAVEPVPVLELWPAPSQDEWDAFSLNYQAGWTPINGSTSEIPIPKYCVPAFISLLRAYVQGLEEPAGGDQEDRVAKVLFGAIMATAASRDDQQEYDYGPARNTAWDQGAQISFNGALVWGSDTILTS